MLWSTNALPEIRTEVGDSARAHLDGAVIANARTISRAPMLWVTGEMTSLVEEAAPTLPDWTPALVMPSPSGIAFFARPLFELISIADGRQNVDVIAWYTRYETPRAPSVDVVVFSRITGKITPVQTVKRIENPHLVKSTDPHAVLEQMLTSIGALWLLMAQPRVAQTRERRVRNRKGAHRRPSRVVTVDVRPVELAEQSADGVDAQDEQEPPEHDHRWWVGGHWRQQACGPGRSQRRPTWIAPYVKGPAGSPLIAKPRVNVVRSG